MAKIIAQNIAPTVANLTHDADENIKIGGIPETAQLLPGANLLKHAVVETEGVVE